MCFSLLSIRKMKAPKLSVSDFFDVTHQPSVPFNGLTVGQQREKIIYYFTAIQMFNDPKTRKAVENNPVIVVYVACGLLANKGNLAYNGEEVVRTTLTICYQLGIAPPP